MDAFWTSFYSVTGIIVLAVLIIAAIGCIGPGIASMLERDGE